ncbi:MAG: hypothetical protein J0L75_07410 [Spirochaetes bacterium]|nr:hypothetical protein [Spirochaetota bacterium]
MLKVRELYCPSHFGNSFEVAGRREMEDFLRGAKDWGVNRYSDWFDPIDLYDPYEPSNNPRNLFNFPESMWRQKFDHYRAAHELGLELGLVLTPNHVYTDQLGKARAAVQGEDPVHRTHVFGQLLCPSDAAARRIILANQENLFRSFRERGMALRSLSLCPYDYGGCLCEACRPWIQTFAALARDIAQLAESFFPGIEANLIGWWWSEAEHQLFPSWCGSHAPSRFHSMAFHLPYDAVGYDPSKRPIPDGCRERSFVHACYGDAVDLPGIGRHNYGHFGAPVAARRMAATHAFLASRKAEGWMAYTEGFHADLNVALLAALGSGQASSAEAVLEEYARRHFGGKNAARWGRWLSGFIDPKNLDVHGARREWIDLGGEQLDGWRARQMEGTLRLFECHQRVEREPSWSPARIAAADAFWEAKEHLYRSVWGLGVPRHIFQMDGQVPAWHAAYLEHQGAMPRSAPSPSTGLKAPKDLDET